MRRAVIQPKDYSERGILPAAWKLLAGIAQRLSASQAGVLIDAAINHSVWTAVPENPRQVIIHRQEMLLALRKVCRTVDEATLERLADATLPLARERKQDYDYAEALNIFCEIVTRCGERLKAKVRNSLYPSGERLTTYLLMLAPHFGKELNKPDSLRKDADMVARNVRLQVQRVKTGEEPEAVTGVLYTQHCDLEDGRHIVSVTGAHDVSAILGQRDVLPRKAIEKVCVAALDMIAESENAIANRVHLAEAVRDVREHCTGRIKTRAWQVLSQVAEGDIAEPSLFMSNADAINPLNPFKMSSGPPSALQGHALYTLAVLESCQPGMWGRKLDPIVCAALRNQNADVRMSGCHAARELSSMSKVLRRSVLFATRDSDPRVIDAALHVLAHKSDRDTEADEWEMIVAVCDLAAESCETVVRRATAYTVPRLTKKCPLPTIKRQLEGLRKRLEQDVCWSVRYLAAEKDAADVALVSKMVRSRAQETERRRKLRLYKK